MNSLGLSLIVKMGCWCFKENVHVNGIKYTKIETLGQGAFSTVYLVEHFTNKKRYALKHLICYNNEDQRKVLNEVNYLKKLQHQNIINLVDSYIKGVADILTNQEADVYLILPLYIGGTLHDLLSKKQKNNTHFDLGDVFRIFRGICDGVKYMHEFKPEPLAHRDLKTANISFKNDFSPVIIDLGSMSLARVQICGTHDAQKMQDFAAENCSAPYRAPELFNVESFCVLDERTDIWSLGCILYAICYFGSPFDAVYLRGDSIALSVLSGVIEFAKETIYPEHIHDLIMYMLNMNPIDRPFIQSVIEKVDVTFNIIHNVT